MFNPGYSSIFTLITANKVLLNNVVVHIQLNKYFTCSWFQWLVNVISHLINVWSMYKADTRAFPEGVHLIQIWLYKNDNNSKI